MKTIERLIPLATWLVIGMAAFLLVHYKFEFHFYYAEQLKLFLYNKAFLSDLFFSFGGVAELTGRWLLQFYIHPKIGVLITTAILLSVGMLMNGIAKKINRNVSLILIPLLTAIFIFFLHLNHNYYIAGTMAYAFALAVFLIYLHANQLVVKIITSTLFTCLLFWWAGSVAFLFAVTIGLWQLLTDRKQVLQALVPLFVVIILAYVSVRLAWVGNYKQIFMPTLYFHPKLTPPTIIYFPWGILLLLVVVSYMLRNLKISRKFQYAVFVCQIIITPVIVYYLIPAYGQLPSTEYKKMDYYVRMERWNDLVEESRKPIANYLHAYYLNIALMETGQLGEQFLRFDQKGIRGLVPTLDKGFPTLIILNELYFTLGDIAASQKFAFESNLTISNNGSPRLYKRLVQTSLINGEYPVAEKYIKLLEQTHSYKKWATEQRRFLYNDKAVEDDSLLGKKRRGRPVENYLLMANDPIYKTKCLLNADPLNKAAFDYLASIFLFGKQVPLFIELVDEYCTTEESLVNLPERFQEAIIVGNENNPDAWERYKINPLVVNKYRSYKQKYLNNKGNPGVVNILHRDFGTTYWLYFLFNE